MTRRKSGEEEQEEEEEVEEEGEEGESEEGEEGGGEEVQLEVISDSITQDTPPAVWQVDVHPLPTCGLPSSTQPTPTAVCLISLLYIQQNTHGNCIMCLYLSFCMQI